MKKLLLAALILVSSASVYADGRHHGGGHHHGHWARHGNGWTWVVPAIIGGAIVYEATRPPVIVQQPPIVVPQSQIVIRGQCSPWTETQNSDGSITRTRTCTE